MLAKMTDVEFPYVRHSDFMSDMSDKADMLASFREDCKRPLEDVAVILKVRFFNLSTN